MQEKQKPFKTGIVWFTNDLRLHDNPALTSAIGECHEIVPVFILDRVQMGKDRYGNLKTGPFRAHFLIQSLQDLSANLRLKGSSLIVRKGNTPEILLEITQKYQAEKLYSARQIWHEEVQREEKVKKVLPLSTYDSNFLIDPLNCPFPIEELPMIFSTFRKKAEKSKIFRKPLPPPEAINSPPLTHDFPLTDLIEHASPPDPRTAFPFEGGESKALKRVREYIWEKELILTYKSTRNGMVGSDYSSKFSPWLTHGCLSPSRIHSEIRKFESERGSNASTYWLKFELLWREFFRYTSMKYGSRMFLYTGIKEKDPGLEPNTRNFLRWKEGKTGDDFVDAHMKELFLTGFMSNRGRQNAASYLVHELKTDWRWGAAWFESLLIDYDPASNFGNWQYVTGIGNDPVENRKFNTRLQAEKYDPLGEFRNLWLGRKDLFS